MSSRLLIASGLAAAVLGLAGSARADVFGPISLVSQGTSPPAHQFEQADYAHHPAISGDGRYVVFDGSYGGIEGVWRSDVASGTIEQVVAGDASLPSISEDGRYVSFTTTERLVPGDENQGPDVYVRDMDIPSSAPCTTTSIGDGSCAFETRLLPQWGGRSGAHLPDDEPDRVRLARGWTLRDERRRTLRRVRDHRRIEPGGLRHTRPAGRRPRSRHARHGAGQRPDRSEHRAAENADRRGRNADEPVPAASERGETFGAVYPGGVATPSFLGVIEGQATVGASISADGSTVAWIGQDIDRQAPVLADELTGLLARYSEPLWRRIQAGPSSPIRRITGGSDPTSPACLLSGETALSAERPTLSDPCQGPFAIEGEATNEGLWSLLNGIDALPRLSADGQQVALLANAREIASGEEFGSSNNFSDDLYVANMSEGLTRVQALKRLTELAGARADELARTAPIADFDISPDGSEVAFTTTRTVFPLGSPAFISSPSAFPGMVELYDADLANDTLTRVTHGFEGENQPSEAPHGESVTGLDPYLSREGAFSPSFSADGASLAFSSTATNLVLGDGNTPSANSPGGYDGSDAFLVSKVPVATTPVESGISSAPPAPSLTPTWKLGATARSRRDGSVQLQIVVPGQGALSATASSRVVVRARVSVRAGGRLAHRSVRTVASRTVASRTAHPSGGGLVTLSLVLTPAFRALAAGRGGLSASVGLRFSATGHPPLRQSIEVRFVKVPAKHASKPHTARHASVPEKGSRR